MTAVRKKKISNSNKADKRGMSYKDVQILFLQEGLQAIEKGLKDGTIKAAILRKAAEAFGDANSGETLVAFTKAKVTTVGRGRRPVEVGDTRTYKAQQLAADKSRFIRLPVDLYTSKKGQPVNVRFEKDRIVVTTA